MGVRYHGGYDADRDPQPDPPGWVDGLPTSAQDQSCAMCGDDPTWVHRLDPAKVTFRIYGKGHTLPTFWSLCDRCEHLYDAGDDEALMRLYDPGWEVLSEQDFEETVRQPVRVFRAADLGARRYLSRP
jgi:hypothetical protein